MKTIADRLEEIREFWDLPKGPGKMRAEERLEQHKAQWADTPNSVDYTRQQARTALRREDKAERRRAAREALMARFAATKARRAARQAKEAKEAKEAGR